MLKMPETCDLIVFSHLRWNFVFQRPQHLLRRFAKHRRVFFFEEPLPSPDGSSFLKTEKSTEGVFVVQPHLTLELPPDRVRTILAGLVDRMIEANEVMDFSLWYYTPMAWPFSRHLDPRAIIYDCMDELSHFKNAPPELVEYESALMKNADVVFTGGFSLYEAKRHLHSNIHPFPSAIDFAHFSKARNLQDEPEDQKRIPGPKLGFFGVIDERMDLKLLEAVSAMKPDWNFVVLGPVVKIDPSELPRRSNIHYLGQKDYMELPRYLSGWDVAMMPFALNDSTKFISPTKTPEYLAAGRPVVSTAIRDVVHPYGTENLVAIARNAQEFVTQAERAMREVRFDRLWNKKVDRFLADRSWDETWKKMADLEKAVSRKKQGRLGSLAEAALLGLYGPI